MKNRIRLNREITAPRVRLIESDGSQAGVVTLDEALERAGASGFDLAEIAPNAEPPVVRILDWGKYQYEQTKQQQKSKKKQKQVEVKQIRLGLKIGDHDFDVKAQRARKFLGEGNKVKVSLFFRGREITRADLGRAVLERFRESLSDIAEMEQGPQQAGREINIILGAKKDAKT